ncbi:MAG: thioredoxin domain-containing protein [Phycisphaerae bacterium]|nr:thioredoxin domain-containing protein [Phycisphaerae bacterium]
MPDELQPTTSPGAARIALLGGALGLVASATLASVKLGLAPPALPGCSGDAGCGSLVNGPWGSVPALGTPWSYVGLVWFAFMLVGLIGWLRARTRPAPWLTVVASVGAVLSIGFVIGMVALGAFCPWCALAHLGSVVVALAVLLAPRRGAPSSAGGWTGLPAAAAVAVVVALLVGGLDATRRLRLAETAANEDASFVRDAAAAPTSTTDRLAGGRELGNAKGRVRVVLFTDYQCPDCAKVEAMAKAVVARGDASVVVKHFPLCAECNSAMPSSPHPDACRRAALAEAAATLGGAPAFAAAHAALFALQATPAADALAAVASATGLDAARLAEVASSSAVQAAVRRDIDDAIALGVTFTPMVFVNGREWKWYVVGGTLDGVVERVADLASAPATPPDATRKLVEDWLVSPRIDALAGPISEGRIALAPKDPRDDDLEVRVWADPRIAGSRELLASLSSIIDAGARIRVRVLQCPASEECNPSSGMTGGDARSCLASAAIVAAGTIGGDEKFRAMLNALLAVGPDVDMTTILEKAAAIGLDHSAFQAQFASGEALASVRREAETLVKATRLVQIPTLVIDGRVVPRWSHPGAPAGDVLRAIIDEARRQ